MPEVALLPDKKRLAVSIATTPGGHDEPLELRHESCALPARVSVP